MQTSTQNLPLKNIPFFQQVFLDYISGEEKLDSLYSSKPKPENFSSLIGSRIFDIEKRKNLVESLEKQYTNFFLTNEVSENIEALLQPTTFTVTTGHQLNIFGGPLYFIYKIITTINTAKELSLEYPNNKIIPVFWMASEDHDFEEINHFNLFGKSWKWDTDQKGAVGRFKTEGIESILTSLPEKIELFHKAYCEHNNLSDATRYFVNELFGNEGLLILDADRPELKKIFAPIIKDEILNKTSLALVEKTNKIFDSNGYQAQVHAREINLFYLDKNIRERIIPEGNNYKVNNTEIHFSEKEILELIELAPEKFSPNVILRPVYQECILPNLAYIGGPAEVVYWLQLKEVFDYHKISFPILLPRNFALYINKPSASKLIKLNLGINELFVSEEELKNNYLLKISEAEFKLDSEKVEIEKIFFSIKEKACMIDRTMEGSVLADSHKTIKLLEDLEKKLKKAEERKNETVLSQVLNLKNKLFPGGGLQERSDNFLNFFLNDPEFLTKIKTTFNPFDFSFYIIREHE